MDNQSHIHKWRFACQLRDDEVSTQTVTVTISNNMTRQLPIVKKKDYYKLLFYCECGELKTVDVSSGGYISNSMTQSARL